MNKIRFNLSHWIGRWVCLCWCACAPSVLLADDGEKPAADAAAADAPADQQADKPTDDAAGVEFFEKQVRPLLVQHCYECHAGSEESGGLLVDAREHLLAGGDSGPAIVPGKPDKSLLIEAVSYKNQDLQMPPQSRLSDAEIATLTEWIERGAPDPRQAAAPAAAPVKGMSLEDGRQFWAFQPVADPTLPEVQRKEWVQTPIDAFILAKLEESGLVPAPPADKRTLLRRVYLDMIGLPPTPAEVDAFLADPSPSAFAQVIERLLQSPHYGVRWGRHWLDVARYADSNGLDENLAYGTAWRYRDYVVDAFNHDKPFNRFLVEQVAGDLLPDANRETHIATGFMLLGAKVLAEPDREKLLMDTIDEQVDTLGKAFLGMTFGCARCHDHKFDPISQADYYALAAIFKSSKTFGDTNTGAIKHWNEYVFATPEEREQLKKIDAAIAEKQKVANTYKNNAIAKVRDEAREKAAAYLEAAAQFDTDTSLVEVARIAEPLGLHPRILHNCRRHLAFHTEDAFFAKWHELVQSGRTDEIAAHYEPLLATAREWAETKKKDAKAKPPEDANVVAAHAALFDNSGFISVPAKAAFALDEATLTEYNRLAEEARLLESFAPDLSSAMSIGEGTVLASLPIHFRGSHRNLGQPVSRGFPKVMQTSPVESIWPRHQSGRLELANWLASTQHPLTARVYVNRIWRWHFGAGIVSSTENFGVLGDRPSHPELLDWLARNFMETGWSTKELHRLILNSSVYQMATVHPGSEHSGEIDPENRLLWRFRPQRLDAEQVRDSILFVSGRLDETLGGKTVPLRNRQFVFDHTSIDHTKYDSLRRALYLPVIRNNVYTLFEQFDFPDPTMPTGSRNATTVAPQALLLMNSDLVMDSADALAKQLIAEHSDETKRIQALTRILWGRDATASEEDQIHNFLTDVTGAGGVANASLGTVEADRAWSLVCQSLIMSNEFFMVR
ncbi:MAG: PSD1 and planctomycete cytochrome C domain-containing protein [Aureliella sp.]